jgi:hypothetical protein
VMPPRRSAQATVRRPGDRRPLRWERYRLASLNCEAATLTS